MIKSERLDQERARRLYLQAIRGAAYAHTKGVLHRDLKPDNMLVHQNGRLVLTDFGIAIKLHNADSSHISTKLAFASLPYAPPELIEDQLSVTQSDIYSMAVTGYRLFTGRLPFDKTRKEALFHSILSETPPDFSDFADLEMTPTLRRLAPIIINEGMAKDPHDRPRTMDRFHELVSNALEQGQAEEETKKVGFIDGARAPRAARSGSTRVAPEASAPKPTKRYTAAPGTPGGPRLDLSPRRGPGKQPDYPVAKPAPRPARPDQKVAPRSKPRQKGTGSGPGLAPKQAAPSTYNRLLDSDKRRTLKWAGLGALGVALTAGAGTATFSQGVKEGWWSSDQPAVAEKTVATPEKMRPELVRATREFFSIMTERKDYYDVALSVRSIAQFAPSVGVEMAQWLFDRAELGYAAMAAIPIAPLQPKAVGKILTGLSGIDNVDSQSSDVLVGLAASMAASDQTLARKANYSFENRLVMDTALDPTSISAKLLPRWDSRLYHNRDVMAALAPRLAAYNPDELLRLARKLPTETSLELRALEAVCVAAMPHHPAIATEIISRIQAVGTTKSIYSAAWLAGAFAPYNPQITLNLAKKYQASKNLDVRGAGSWVELALGGSHPEVLRKRLQQNPTPDFWHYARSLALDPSNKQALSQMLKAVRAEGKEATADASWLMHMIVSGHSKSSG
jgi:hypothetical protein